MSYDLKIIKGDLAIQSGNLQLVYGSDKLTRDILKICLTTAGTNILYPWYGSFISRTMIGNSSSTSSIIQIGKSQLTTALNNLKQLQQKQLSSFQRVSADEQLAAITDISIVQSQINPTFFSITIQAKTKGLKPITTSFSINTIT